MKQKSIPICPQCESINVKSVYLASPSELSRAGSKKFHEQSKKCPVGALLTGWRPENPSIYICNDCDYYGICPEVEQDKIKGFRKNLKDKKK